MNKTEKVEKLSLDFETSFLVCVEKDNDQEIARFFSNGNCDDIANALSTLMCDTGDMISSKRMRKMVFMATIQAFGKNKAYYTEFCNLINNYSEN